jgi:cytochrome c-type biogenesis protein CcmF
VALRRGFADDLYIVLAGFTAETQEAKLQVKVNPLVNWIWMGVGIMLIGTVIALLPERAFAFATSRVPAGAAPTTLVILLLMMSAMSAGVRAQHVASPQNVPVVPRTPLERDLQGQIVCMCGTCGRQRISECTCSTAAEMRQELAALTAKGMTHDEIVAYYVDKWGSQEVLAAPIDKGFNRLAWLLPYGIGVAGVAMIAGLAIKWSRRTAEPASPAALSAGVDQALQQRLDDELRDLD